jgi:hypothetical protein
MILLRPTFRSLFPTKTWLARCQSVGLQRHIGTSTNELQVGERVDYQAKYAQKLEQRARE